VRRQLVALAVQLALGAALVALAANDFAPFAGGSGGAATPAAVVDGVPAPTANRFDERHALALLREQVERYGVRPAGSESSRRLAVRLRGLLPGGRFEAVPGGMRNVVGRLPGRLPAIVLGAHYDTEPTVPH
jgi:glutaminyl-peptide cyclotransferase